MLLSLALKTSIRSFPKVTTLSTKISIREASSSGKQNANATHAVKNPETLDPQSKASHDAMNEKQETEGTSTAVKGAGPKAEGGKGDTKQNAGIGMQDERGSVCLFVMMKGSYLTQRRKVTKYIDSKQTITFGHFEGFLHRYTQKSIIVITLCHILSTKNDFLSIVTLVQKIFRPYGCKCLSI